MAPRQRPQPGCQGQHPGAAEKCDRQATVGGRILALSREQVPGSPDVKRALRSLCLLIVAPSLASAHDCWLEADDFHIPEGAKVVVHLNLGESLTHEEEKPFEKERTERFELRLQNYVRDLLPAATEGAKPVFTDALPGSGPFLFSMVRGSTVIELERAKFDEYLAHEGIVLSERTTRPIERERYWRFIKLLGRSGDETETDLHHRFTGMQYEIVLLQNPFTMHAGDEQIVQLLFETKPLANATVSALHRATDGSLVELKGVSDARGVARFTLVQPGVWLIRSVHMRPCKGCKDADWESFWATYSFAME